MSEISLIPDCCIALYHTFRYSHRERKRFQTKEKQKSSYWGTSVNQKVFVVFVCYLWRHVLVLYRRNSSSRIRQISSEWNLRGVCSWTRNTYKSKTVLMQSSTLMEESFAFPRILGRKHFSFNVVDWLISSLLSLRGCSFLSAFSVL